MVRAYTGTSSRKKNVTILWGFTVHMDRRNRCKQTRYNNKKSGRTNFHYDGCGSTL